MSDVTVPPCPQCGGTEYYRIEYNQTADRHWWNPGDEAEKYGGQHDWKNSWEELTGSGPWECGLCHYTDAEFAEAVQEAYEDLG